MKVINILSYLAVSFALTVLFISIYWLLEPVHIIDAPNPFEVVKSEYLKGEVLEYKTNYCKYSNKIPIVVKRQLVDGYVYDLPVSTNSNFPKGCHEVKVLVPLTIPQLIPSGEYHLRITATYQVNPLKQYTYTWITNNFTLK